MDSLLDTAKAITKCAAVIGATNINWRTVTGVLLGCILLEIVKLLRQTEPPWWSNKWSRSADKPRDNCPSGTKRTKSADVNMQGTFERRFGDAV